MKAQQAPSPRQARPLSACQTASIKAQRITGGIATASSHAATKVRIVLPTLLKRLLRIHAIRPAVADGGRSAGNGRSCVVSVIV